MIEPLLSGQAFLDDVEASLKRPEQVHVWWLGQSGFLLQCMEDFIAVDPYLSDSLTTKYAATDKPHVRVSKRVVDPAGLNFAFLILCSHIHTDHLDAETLRPMLTGNATAQVVAPAAILSTVAERSGESLDKLWPMDDGSVMTLGGFRITAIPSAHETVERDERGRCKFLGFVIEINGIRIYHSGDTMLYDGLADRLRTFDIDIALLPINGRKPERRVAGNLNGREAAQLAKDIGAKLVIPHHYDMFAFNTADPAEEFIPECERLLQPYRVLRLGERHSIPSSGTPEEATRRRLSYERVSPQYRPEYGSEQR